MERVSAVLREAEDYIKRSALALFFLHLFGETSEVLLIKINTMFLLLKTSKIKRIKICRFEEGVKKWEWANITADNYDKYISMCWEP